jgi:hypothetical protein
MRCRPGRTPVAHAPRAASRDSSHGVRPTLRANTRKSLTSSRISHMHASGNEFLIALIAVHCGTTVGRRKESRK